MKISLIKTSILIGLCLGLSAVGWAQDSEIQTRLDALNGRLSAIQKRTESVADVNELESLQKIYGYYTDKKLWDQVIDLFTEDGTMEIGTSGIKEGKSSIKEYLYNLSNNQQGPFEGDMYNHFQLQPVITVSEDGQSALGRWRAFMQLGTHGAGSGGQWGEGPYENEYVKENGVWKIKTLHWFATFVGPYEGGWAEASKELVDAYSGSDGSSSNSANDYSFPNVTRPDFHYPNPVTGE